MLLMQHAFIINNCINQPNAGEDKEKPSDGKGHSIAVALAPLALGLGSLMMIVGADV